MRPSEIDHIKVSQQKGCDTITGFGRTLFTYLRLPPVEAAVFSIRMLEKSQIQDSYH